MADENPVTVTRDGALAIVAMDGPPVNALGLAMRTGLMDAFASLAEASDVRAVVLIGTKRAFSGGADITEFGKPRAAPGLKDIIARIEDFGRPVIAAISGVALGGGFELALGCHYRVASPDARVGLPEVKLGILPGAGGTQRLPRAIGIAAALRAIVLGEFMSAAEAQAAGAIDAVLDGEFRSAALDWARAHLASGDTRLPRLRTHDDKLIEGRADPGLIDRLAAPLLKRAKGKSAPKNCVEAVRAAVMHPFGQGLAEEARLFEELVRGDESRAQRHVFFAEREATKAPGLTPDVKAMPVRSAAVLGAGTMGGGIAMCFANAGIPVTIVDADAAALGRGMERVRDNYRIAVSRGSLTEPEMERRLALFRPSPDFGAIAEGDVVIEAVFEDMDLKRRIFADLDRVARPGALLASNTSTLDIDEIARQTKRPQDVLGMHFFSPANVMRLLEIVRGERTSPEALATAIAVGRAIGKQCAVVGNCDGFVGNRMLARRAGQAERLLLEGALPEAGRRRGHGVRVPDGSFRDGRPGRPRRELAYPQASRHDRPGRGRAVRGGTVRPEDRGRLFSIRRPHADARSVRDRPDRAPVRRTPSRQTGDRCGRDRRANGVSDGQRSGSHPRRRHRDAARRHRRDLGPRLRFPGLARRPDALGR